MTASVHAEQVALAALARIDDGEGQPGDRELADTFDRHCEWGQPPAPCVICGRRLDGPECASCTARWDEWIGRGSDV